MMSDLVQNQIQPGRLPRFKRPILPERLCNLDRLLATMEQRGLDGVVAYLRPNVLYLSSFAPPSGASVHETNGYAAVVISRHAPHHPVIVVAEFDLPYFASQPSWIKDVRPFATLITPLDVNWGSTAGDRFIPTDVRALDWVVAARSRYEPSLVDGVRGALADLGLVKATVGFDDLRLAHALEEPDRTVADAYGTIKFVRQVKTAAEIDLLRTATALNQRAIEQTIDLWSPGMTWQEMIHAYHVQAVTLGGFVRDPGAVVVANSAGADAAFYTGAGLEEFVIEPGMHIMWDCHGTWGHYCWDGGKTWVVGDEPHGLAQLIAQATAAAMAEIQRVARPGVRISQLQQAARAALSKSGTPSPDDVFIFFHGLGLEHIDMELTSSRQDWSLEAGMVISAHLQVPGDDRTRSWLEEIMLVTEAGGDSLFTWGHEPITGSRRTLIQ
ncbi:MAG: M24 family metallopeptidase [Chloroflexota bacterium]